MSNAAPAAAKKPSALETLKGLTKKPDAGVAIPASITSLNDPAIVGAKRDRNTVKLGYDPAFARRARYCANLHAALERAEADFAVFQGETRDYGLTKRGAYNDAYRTNVTTVCVPYPEHVVEDEATGTFQPAPGSEMKWVQVICTNRWSVSQDMVLSNRDRLGEDNFGRLFKVETTRSLKPNAEELFRNLLIELGAADEDSVGDLMAQLFESKTKVSAQEGYEQEVARLPAPIQDLLKQMVTRAQPGLKFPDT